MSENFEAVIPEEEHTRKKLEHELKRDIDLKNRLCMVEGIIEILREVKQVNEVASLLEAAVRILLPYGPRIDVVFRERYIDP